MISKASKRITMIANQLKSPFSTEGAVLIDQNKNGIKLVLNKPSALNAIDLPMIEFILDKIPQWNSEPKIKVHVHTQLCRKHDFFFLLLTQKFGE